MKILFYLIDSESAASKVPTNIRQKYLDTLVDECLKIYPTNTAAAYQRAEEEEKVCAEKSKTRSIYLNSVVMCIKRLRNEAKEINPTSKKAVEFKNTTPNMLTTHLQTLLGKFFPNFDFFDFLIFFPILNFLNLFPQF